MSGSRRDSAGLERFRYNEGRKSGDLLSANMSDVFDELFNLITPERIRSMKRQGFSNLTLEQIVKLSRGGVI